MSAADWCGDRKSFPTNLRGTGMAIGCAYRADTTAGHTTQGCGMTNHLLNRHGSKVTMRSIGYLPPGPHRQPLSKRLAFPNCRGPSASILMACCIHTARDGVGRKSFQIHPFMARAKQ